MKFAIPGVFLLFLAIVFFPNLDDGNSPSKTQNIFSEHSAERYAAAFSARDLSERALVFAETCRKTILGQLPSAAFSVNVKLCSCISEGVYDSPNKRHNAIATQLLLQHSTEKNAQSVFGQAVFDNKELMALNSNTLKIVLKSSATLIDQCGSDLLKRKS